MARRKQNGVRGSFRTPACFLCMPPAGRLRLPRSNTTYFGTFLRNSRKTAFRLFFFGGADGEFGYVHLFRL